MRTPDEILFYLKTHGDVLGFQREVLVPMLPYEKAKPFLKAGVTEESWPEKALGHRGISASRSVEKMKAWLWLLGDDETLAFAENDDNYPQYGVPVLKHICENYGFPIPDDEAVARMAVGERCHPKCDEGCGQ